MNMIATQTVTMSSREIAELVEKRHDNVKRTIETLATRGVIGLPQIEEYRDSLGRTAQEYQICKRDSYVIVAQLSPEFTARLVDRWQELEGNARPMTAAEMFLQNAELLLNLERQQVENQQALKAIGARVDLIEDTSPLKVKPQNTEAITEIRRRMNKKHGLPERIVNEVMTKLPYSPRPFAMVKNSNENAQGSSFAVWLIKDVTKLFDRFVSECGTATKTTCTHPSIDGRFKMNGPAEAATSPSHGSTLL